MSTNISRAFAGIANLIESSEGQTTMVGAIATVAVDVPANGGDEAFDVASEVISVLDILRVDRKAATVTRVGSVCRIEHTEFGVLKGVGVIITAPAEVDGESVADQLVRRGFPVAVSA